MRTAACHCGRLAIQCVGEPTKVSLCHCLDCQRRTGSLFSVAAFFPRESVTIERGAARMFDRPSASGYDVAFHFCADCGSTLWWRAARLPHLIGVAVGSFADTAFPPPEQVVWAQDKHEWLPLLDGIPAHARNPVRAPSA